MIGEFHLNYTKDESSTEFILIFFGLPIMDVAGNAVGSTSDFSNPYCPRSREDWYVPSRPTAVLKMKQMRLLCVHEDGFT